MKDWFKGFLQNKKEAWLQIALVAGIIILVNVLISSFFWQMDFTEDHVYTLSKPSQNIAETIKDPITVTAYFSNQLPPQLNRVKNLFKSFLEEFRSYSHGNLEYKFVDPGVNTMSEQKAQQSGIQPVLLDVRQRDQVSQKKVYLGAVFQYHGKSQSLPVIRPGAGLEFEIASTVKKLIIKKKPKIGLLQGDGEPTSQDLGAFMNELKQEYDVVNISGLDTTQVSPDIKVLLIIHPTKELKPHALQAIDQYIMAGGKAVFAIDRISVNLQQGFAHEMDTGIEKLLAAYDIPVKADLVFDASSSAINVRRQSGGFSFVNQVQYPYIPVITHFADHPITKGLESVMMPFASTVDTSKVDSLQHVVVLAQTSTKSGTASGYFNISPFQQWKRNDFIESNLPVAALVKGIFSSAYAKSDSVHVRLKKSVATSIVVIGNGNFIDNSGPLAQQQLPDDNINLMVNSVDWLADDTGLMALRTKGITDRPLAVLDDSTKNILKYLNVFLPIIIVIGYGGFRYQRKKARRNHWMEEEI